MQWVVRRTRLHRNRVFEHTISEYINHRIKQPNRHRTTRVMFTIRV